MVAVQEKKAQKVEFLQLNLPSGGFSDDDFFEFCQLNDNLRIERLATGKLIIKAPTGGKTGIYNAELNAEIGIWNRIKKQGKVFDSSTGFKLENGAIYSPDVSWITKEKWNNLSAAQQKKWVPFAPDFMCELVSNKGQRKEIVRKIVEFIENGTQLGWMIDPFGKETHVFRPSGEVVQIPFNQPVFGGRILEGLEIVMEDVLD